MGHAGNNRSLLATAVDMHQWLEADQSSMQERSQRDRALGRDQSSVDDVSRLLNWWAQVAPATDQQATRGQRVIKVRRWLSAGLFAVGVFLGLTLCSLALTYHGDYPVNLLAVLGVLVGIPALMLLLTLVSGALQGVASNITHEFVNTLNINRWIMGVWERLSGDQYSNSFGQGDARRCFAYWQVVTFSQIFTVGYFVGVLSMYGLLVAFTDLAFGWSTTLELQAVTVYEGVLILASPWAGLLPAAVPDANLVEISRFYRLTGVVADEQAAQLGQWWQFVFMVILVWGLIPRLALWSYGGWRLRVASRALLVEHTQVSALLDRLKTPLVARVGATHAVELDELIDPVAADVVAQAATLELSNAVVMVWNEAKAPATISGQLGEVIALNTFDSEHARREALSEMVPNLAPNADRLIVYTKGWEPPLLEFDDLLELVREVVGKQLSIVVSPLGLVDQRLTDSDLAIWSAAVARLNDPRIYVSNDPQEPS